jgi:hypothetical protein
MEAALVSLGNILSTLVSGKMLLDEVGEEAVSGRLEGGTDKTSGGHLLMKQAMRAKLAQEGELHDGGTNFVFS